MKTKFPFHSDVLKHAKVTDIKIRAVSGPDGAQTSDLEFFLERFPCLIPAGVSKQTVLEKFAEYQSDNLTQIISDPQFEETRNDVLWVSIGKLKDAVGVVLFQNLARVMLGILTIPHSNASC